MLDFRVVLGSWPRPFSLNGSVSKAIAFENAFRIRSFSRSSFVTFEAHTVVLLRSSDSFSTCTVPATVCCQLDGGKKTYEGNSSCSMEIYLRYSSNREQSICRVELRRAPM